MQDRRGKWCTIPRPRSPGVTNRAQGAQSPKVDANLAAHRRWHESPEESQQEAAAAKVAAAKAAALQAAASQTAGKTAAAKAAASQAAAKAAAAKAAAPQAAASQAAGKEVVHERTTKNWKRRAHSREKKKDTSHPSPQESDGETYHDCVGFPDVEVVRLGLNYEKEMKLRVLTPRRIERACSVVAIEPGVSITVHWIGYRDEFDETLRLNDPRILGPLKES